VDQPLVRGRGVAAPLEPARRRRGGGGGGVLGTAAICSSGGGVGVQH
jgi:hypothetical protein